MKKTEEVTETKKEQPGDAVWAAIKDVPMSVFALPPKKVSEYFTMVTTVDDAVMIRLTSGATAAVAALEQALNVRTSPQGDQKQVERFLIAVADNGLITVKFKTALPS